MKMEGVKRTKKSWNPEATPTIMMMSICGRVVGSVVGYLASPASLN
jgi:hypothetical protein